MRISIVIPILDEADHIGALLSDLTPLRALGHEVILVDGGSTDATPTLAASKVDRVLATGRGRAVQMNAGARAAGGEVLWFLHADSRLPADAGNRAGCSVPSSSCGGCDWPTRWAPIPPAWRGAMTVESLDSGTLIVFARESVPGQVKTRLIPALGAEGAARLYRRLLGIALRAVATTPCARRQLWCAGAPAAGGECARLAAGHGCTWHHQGPGDLGVRMSAALAEALAATDRAILIGSDCPDYTPAYLSAAFAALADRDAVLGPAADGGYVLIGLRRPAPELGQIRTPPPAEGAAGTHSAAIIASQTRRKVCPGSQ